MESEKSAHGQTSWASPEEGRESTFATGKNGDNEFQLSSSVRRAVGGPNRGFQ